MDDRNLNQFNKDQAASDVAFKVDNDRSIELEQNRIEPLIKNKDVRIDVADKEVSGMV